MTLIIFLSLVFAVSSIGGLIKGLCRKLAAGVKSGCGGRVVWLKNSCFPSARLAGKVQNQHYCRFKHVTVYLTQPTCLPAGFPCFHVWEQLKNTSQRKVVFTCRNKLSYVMFTCVFIQVSHGLPLIINTLHHTYNPISHSLFNICASNLVKDLLHFGWKWILIKVNNNNIHLLLSGRSAGRAAALRPPLFDITRPWPPDLQSFVLPPESPDKTCPEDKQAVSSRCVFWTCENQLKAYKMDPVGLR